MFPDCPASLPCSDIALGDDYSLKGHGVTPREKAGTRGWSKLAALLVAKQLAYLPRRSIEHVIRQHCCCIALVVSDTDMLPRCATQSDQSLLLPVGAATASTAAALPLLALPLATTGAALQARRGPWGPLALECEPRRPRQDGIP